MDTRREEGQANSELCGGGGLVGKGEGEQQRSNQIKRVPSTPGRPL